jgi:hypothetical protein
MAARTSCLLKVGQAGAEVVLALLHAGRLGPLLLGEGVALQQGGGDFLGGHAARRQLVQLHLPPVPRLVLGRLLLGGEAFGLGALELDQPARHVVEHLVGVDQGQQLAARDPIAFPQPAYDQDPAHLADETIPRSAHWR